MSGIDRQDANPGQKTVGLHFTGIHFGLSRSTMYISEPNKFKRARSKLQTFEDQFSL